MNANNIQRLIDLPNAAGAVKLPAGEFEGPFTVTRPCVISGSGTTLWRRDGTVLEIRTKGAVLRDMSVEVTGTGGGTAILCGSGDAGFENVSVYGDIQGVPGEDGHWDIPRVISVGSIAPDREFCAAAEIFVPVPVKIAVNVSGIRAEPDHLSPGMNTVRFIIDPIPEGTVIYGDIEFRSRLVRRAYITVSASAAGNSERSGDYFFRASVPQTGMSAPAYIPPNNYVPSERRSDVIRLVRGGRIGIDELGGDVITAELVYASADRKLDIDGYVFLLDFADTVKNDKSLVFFGNPVGAGGAVTYNDEKDHRTVEIELSRIPQDISRISIAYSIYGEDPADNFSRVHGAALLLKCGDKTVEFVMEGFFLEKTIVAAEIYRRKDSWRISAVGQGYSKGLRRLCESYGLKVI